MRYTISTLILAALLARPCLAIEEAISVDTTHPRATLAPLSGIQGMSKDLRVYVFQSGQAYTGITNASLSLFYGTNLTATAVGTATNISIRTNDWSALIHTGPLPPGRFTYALAIMQAGEMNDLGTGVLGVAPSSFAGGFSPMPGQMIDWSTMTWTGSNQPARETEMAAATLALSALGLVLSNSVSVAMTNWSAALAMFAQVSSNTAWRLLGSVSFATNSGYAATAGTSTWATAAGSATTAAIVTGTQSNLIATALQAEVDTLSNVTTRGRVTSYDPTTYEGIVLPYINTLFQGRIGFVHPGDPYDAYLYVGPARQLRYQSGDLPHSFQGYVLLGNTGSTDGSSLTNITPAQVGAEPAGTAEAIAATSVWSAAQYPLALTNAGQFATALQGTYADGWASVSNAVEAGAALGATSLQSVPPLLKVIQAGSNTTNGFSLSGQNPGGNFAFSPSITFNSWNKFGTLETISTLYGDENGLHEDTTSGGGDDGTLLFGASGPHDGSGLTGITAAQVGADASGSAATVQNNLTSGLQATTNWVNALNSTNIAVNNVVGDSSIGNTNLGNRITSSTQSVWSTFNAVQVTNAAVNNLVGGPTYGNTNLYNLVTNCPTLTSYNAIQATNAAVNNLVGDATRGNSNIYTLASAAVTTNDTRSLSWNGASEVTVPAPINNNDAVRLIDLNNAKGNTIIYYVTTNVHPKNSSWYVLSTNCPANNGFVAYTNPSVNSYLNYAATTDRFTSISGATDALYSRLNGAGNAAVHLESYVSYDGTNLMLNVDSSSYALTATNIPPANLPISGTVATSTNTTGFLYVRAIKVDSASGNPVMQFYMGGTNTATTTASSVTLQTPGLAGATGNPLYGNGVSGTDPVGNTFANGLITAVGSSAPTATYLTNSTLTTASLSLTGQVLVGIAQASGGTITYVGGKEIHTFVSSGSFVLSSVNTAAVLIVAGGGGGGADAANGSGAGGGGAGGLIYSNSMVITAGTYTVTIGAGGIGSTNRSVNGGSGSNTMAFSLTAIGGGYGCGYITTPGNGGSGGAAAGQFVRNGGTGTVNQGNNGGASTSGNYGGSGGGGYGGAGATAVGNAGGVGGSGFYTNITGSFNTYASGGGGGIYFGSSGTSTASVNGVNGTGGGGAGGMITTSSYANGGSGGSGVVVISIPGVSGNTNATGQLAISNGAISTTNRLVAGNISSTQFIFADGSQIKSDGANAYFINYLGTVTNKLTPN